MGIKPEYNHQSRTNKLRRCAASSSASHARACRKFLIFLKLNDYILRIIRKTWSYTIRTTGGLADYKEDIMYETLPLFLLSLIDKIEHYVRLSIYR